MNSEGEIEKRDILTKDCEIVFNWKHGCEMLQLSCQAFISAHTAVMTALTKSNFHERT